MSWIWNNDSAGKNFCLKLKSQSLSHEDFRDSNPSSFYIWWSNYWRTGGQLVLESNVDVGCLKAEAPIRLGHWMDGRFTKSSRSDVHLIDQPWNTLKNWGTFWGTFIWMNESLTKKFWAPAENQVGKKIIWTKRSWIQNLNIFWEKFFIGIPLDTCWSELLWGLVVWSWTWSRLRTSSSSLTFENLHFLHHRLRPSSLFLLSLDDVCQIFPSQSRVFSVLLDHMWFFCDGEWGWKWTWFLIKAKNFEQIMDRRELWVSAFPPQKPAHFNCFHVLMTEKIHLKRWILLCLRGAQRNGDGGWNEAERCSQSSNCAEWKRKICPKQAHSV